MLKAAESIVYEFGEYRFNADNRRLFRLPAGELVHLQPKAAELLLFLLINRERVLTKNELLDTVWEDNFVEESNLSQTIFVLRKALHETSKEPHFILTIPNQGYQFIAQVKEIHAEDNILEEVFLSDASEIPSSKIEIQDSRFKIQNSEELRTKDKGQRTKLIWLAAISLILLIALGAYWFYPKAKPAGLSEIKTMAILPFEDLSEGQTEKYLGMSLADALANKFSGLKQITVRPTRTVLKYTESREDAVKIGRELQVDAVLDGRIQRVGERIRINVQLIRTADNATIWTDVFDDEFTNFFAVQDSISQKVVQSLALKLDDKEREIFNRHNTENAEAYQDYLRGRYFLNKRINDNLPKAVMYFEQAIKKDPNFALAYSGLANCHSIMPEYAATSTLESYPLARKYALKALELNEEIGEAHALLGLITANQTGFSAETEKQFRRAIELDPNFVNARRWLAINFSAQKRYDEALAELKKASELDPLSAIVMINTAQTYKEQGNYDAAIEQLNKALTFDPNFAITHDELARVLYKKGLFAEALIHSQKAVDLSDRLHTLLVTLCEIYIKLGERGKALEVIKELEEKYQSAASYYIAMLYAEYGDREKMYAWLERAIKEKPRDLHELKDEPNFAPYRNEPRFQDLVRRIEL